MNTVAGTTRPSLTQVRDHLYALHGNLVQGERRAAERAGEALHPAEFLQALLHRPEHAWLRPLSTLLARIDQHLAQTHRGGEPPAESAETLLGALRQLVGPPRKGTRFGDRYLARLQRDPEVVIAHARLRGALYRSAGQGAAAA